MRRILIASALTAVLVGGVWAADNALIVTPGIGITTKSKDMGGGVQSAQPNLIDQAGAEVLGQVTASPAANTVLDRLKTLNTTLGSPFQAGGSIGNTTFGATQGTSPWVSSISTWASGTLGAMANYGTSPGAVLVPGVNAFVTNSPSVTGTVTANAGTNLNTSSLALDATVVTTNTDVGPPGATACATDTGSCSLNALLQRIAQRITSAIAGTTVSGTVAATQSGTWTVQPGNTANTTAWKVDGSAVTQPVSGTVTANAGTNLNTSALALDASVGTTNTDIGPPGATACSTDTGSCSMNALLQRVAQRITSAIAGTTISGTVQPGNTANTTPWLVQDVPGTSGGLTMYTLEPAASDNHTNVKNGAGQVYHVMVSNNSATVNYLRFYNAATGFNGCGSATNLVYEMAIPASTSGAGFVQDIAQGIAFSTGISICVVGAYGTAATTNATASAMSVNVGYK